MVPGKIPIDKIKVGKRHRKELGELDSLMASIAIVGLIHPVVLMPDHTLLAGWRRLEAVRRLGKKEIKYVVAEHLDDAVRQLVAQRDENTCRKGFSPSEAVSLGLALEKLERPAAKKRQEEHAGTAPGVKKNTSGNLPEVFKGQTRDKVGKALGMGGQTYRKAKAVVQSGDQTLIDQMDQTGKVEPVYRKLRPETARAKGKSNGSSKKYTITARQIGELKEAAKMLEKEASRPVMQINVLTLRKVNKSIVELIGQITQKGT